MLEVQSFLQSITSKKDNSEDYCYLSHLLCKTYGWDYYTLINQPIPFVLSLMQSIKEDVEREQKEANKIKRRR